MGDDDIEYGDTWVYESIVGALPGIDISDRLAVAIQLGLFEVALLIVGVYYGLETAMMAGTAAVIVAAAGSAVMLVLSERTRSLPAPVAYRRLLFGSNVEVVLGVLAFVALITHLFVYDPRQPGVDLLTSLFGPEPPAVAVYLMLLILWDVAYRIGTSWWAIVVAVWRSYRYSFPSDAVRSYRRTDLLNVAFSGVQALLLPFVVDHPVLFAVIGGHVVAVLVAASLSLYFLHRNEGIAATTDGAHG
ncbi:hypothetical protein BRD17_06320 [Halobacteriales archaeon SW_7_68_16]|nr:MAG: hypothetical protein BRD17_06320 [Halobacteriales archaeon SW_7_68_16]